MNKKITIISGYYYPEDTAVGLYNTQMVEFLESKGYEVTIVTGFPNYPQWKIRDAYKNKKTFFKEFHNSTKIYRYKQYVPPNPTFLKRILLIFDFTLGSFFNMLKIKECDAVISVVPYTSTMLLGYILKYRTNSILWNHIQDFELEAVKESGIYTKESTLKKVVFKILFKIERKLLSLGNINSSISYNMLKKLEHKHISNTFYFPNWVDPNTINPVTCKTHKYLRSKRFKILYSGNIGEKQDWEFFLLFADKLKNYDLDITVIGDGSKKKWLFNELEKFSNVRLYQPIDYKDLPDLLCSADLHILFQKNEVIDSVMPSKLLGMMASEKPSLITGNENSEVKIIINESKGGYYVSNKDIDSCISFVDKLMKSPLASTEIGINARKYIINKFSSDKVLSSFEIKLSKLIKK